ncbi:MAG: MDR/zinc-dependent alcohol dehydrogenase-like family protein [Planctomycetota bacterium]
MESARPEPTASADSSGPPSMVGVFFEGGRVALRRDLPRPTAHDGESRIAVRRAGICATDLALSRGYMGFRGIPGHEFIGRAIDGPLAGRRVVGEINAGCGRCARCLAGDPRHCEQRSVLGIVGRPGAFAEELTLPTCNLLEVPDSVSDDAATFVEPLAAACALVERDPVETGMPALVVGDGRLGLLCAAVLREAGAEVSLLGRHPERADLLGGGIRHLGRPLDDSSPQSRFPLVVEASGHPECLQRALAWVEPRGRLVLKTTTERRIELDPTPIVVDEITLQGSRCGRFDSALALLERGTIDPRPLVDSRFKLEQATDALEHAARRGVLKVLIEIDSP